MQKKPHNCPCCGVRTSIVHDYRKQIINNIPAFGKHVVLILNKRRFACKDCKKRFFEENKWLPRYHRIISKLYDKPCYGYRTNAKGKLVIDKKQKSVVQKIFELYLSGYSILGIIRYLEEKKIASPSGKPKWSKRSVALLLSNEKCIGNVIVGKTYCDEYPNNQRRINKGEQKKYLLKDSHEPIITTEQFEAVQAEKLRRSNIQISESSVSRKKTHYSMKNIDRVE